MAGRFCQECGAPNEAIAQYCAKCGAVLKSGVPPAAPPAPPAWGPPGYAAPGHPRYSQAYPAYDYAGATRQKMVDRTRWGVILLAISAILAWIPLVNALGGLLGLVGAILGIMGRKAFGTRHANFVIVSVVVWLLAAVPAILGAFSLGFTVGASQDLRSVASGVWPLLAGAVVGAIIQSIAWVLFVHELSTKQGRILLYLAALVGAIVGPIVLVFVVGPKTDAIVAAVENGSIRSVAALLDRLSEIETILDLALAPSMILFGLAYILVHQRISKREIPAVPGAAAPWPVVPPPVALPPPPPPPGSAGNG